MLTRKVSKITREHTVLSLPPVPGCSLEVL